MALPPIVPYFPPGQFPPGQFPPGQVPLQILGQLPWEVPVVPGADGARKLAQEELAQKVYQDAKPGLAEQIGALLQRAFNDLVNNVGVPDGNVALAIATGVVVLAIAAIILVIRPRLSRRNAAVAEVFDGASVLSSEQHRNLARTAAAAGDFHTAVSEQFRAMVRAGEERDVSTPAVGRTAMEVATELERAFPPHSGALHHSAELFNAVRYGHAPPTAAMYSELADTDKAVAATKPVYADRLGAQQFHAEEFPAGQVGKQSQPVQS